MAQLGPSRSKLNQLNQNWNNSVLISKMDQPRTNLAITGSLKVCGSLLWKTGIVGVFFIIINYLESSSYLAMWDRKDPIKTKLTSDTHDYFFASFDEDYIYGK